MSSQQYPASHEEAYQALVQLLEQGDEAQSCYSAKAIAQAQYQDAIPQLNNCLYHQDVDVVIDASKALGELGQGDIHALIDVAKNHPDGDARQAALIALSKQTCLQDKQHPDRVAIVELLQTMAQGRLEEDNWGMDQGWDEWWDLQLLAVKLLGQVASDSATALFKQLLDYDPEPELEMALYNALAQLDLDYCQALLEQQPNLSQARKITKAISSNTSHEASVLLFKQLSHYQDIEIKIIAIKALASRANQDYQWDIANLLCDDNIRVQDAALTALKQLDVLADISLSNLETLAKRKKGSNLSTLLSLIDKHPMPTSEGFISWLSQLLAQHSLQQVLGAARIIAHKSPPDEHYHGAFNRILALAKDPLTDQASRIDCIHLLGQFSHKSGPLLSEYRTLLDEKHHDVMIRKACFESLSHFAHEPAYQALLMGSILQPEENTHLIPGQTETATAKPNKTAAIKVSSTLAAIAQENQNTPITSQSIQHQDHINNMVAGLEQEFEEYASIVSGHFKDSDKLDLNRRKIAKQEQTCNQILAIRTLANCPNEFAAPLLLEALLGATPPLQTELFNSMARLAEKQGTSLLKNSLGPLAGAMHHGESLSKQAATRLLAQLRNRQSLTLILAGCQDPDEHVRICSLMALETHMDAKQSTLMPLLEIQRHLQLCLLDKSGGVRKRALPLLARLQQEDDVDSLLECALYDEESQSIAAQNLRFAKDKSLSLLAKKLPNLENRSQYLAIQLTGELLAY